MDIIELKKSVLDMVGKTVKEVFEQTPEGLTLGFPPNVSMGNFAIGCFPLAEKLKTKPKDIAEQIVSNLEAGDAIGEVTATGPYININIPPALFFGSVCDEIISKDQEFGKSSSGDSLKIMVEYLSPNTNKPLHLGHIRNGALGMAIANMLEAIGHKVIKANLVNDRGIHICQSMIAWKKWGENSTPESTGLKGDHFMGKWYVKFFGEIKEDESLEDLAQEMLVKWEQGDPVIMKDWKMMRDWVCGGFEETYEMLGLKFDIFYYESFTFKLGKDIVQRGIEEGVFKKYTDPKKGNVSWVYFLPKNEFGLDKEGNIKVATVLREDDTSVYMTQDLGTAVHKIEDHGLDYSIYVVANEQDDYFKRLFKILKVLGFEWAKDCRHLSYGMVNLPEGRMKSREGTVVDADDLISGMEEIATEEIRKRNEDNPLPENEVKERAHIIALAAVKFYLLKVKPTQGIDYDPTESLSFEGFTGPYCLYAYARISAILRIAAEQEISFEDCDFSVLGNEEELMLCQLLFQFSDVVRDAADGLNPLKLLTHVHALAKVFSQFYNKHRVLDAKGEALVKARLVLIKATAIALKNGLNLLGIDVLEKM
ncbi:MAG: arginine--tRNA ligase [Patescibacteria group bacterium]